MPRKPADQTVQRSDILLAAAHVFQERGYHAAKMADIARRVNLTAGSLYHHFPAGKRDLLLAVLNEGLDTILTQMDAILAQKLPADETLRRLIELHVKSVTQHVAVGAAMVFEIQTVLDFVMDDNERDRHEQIDSAGRASFLLRRDAFEHRLRQVVEQGMAEGVFRRVDAPIFTKTLLGAQNWVSVWYHPGGRLTGEQIAEQIAAIFLAALRC